MRLGSMRYPLAHTRPASGVRIHWNNSGSAAGRCGFRDRGIASRLQKVQGVRLRGAFGLTTAPAPLRRDSLRVEEPRTVMAGFAGLAVAR